LIGGDGGVVEGRTYAEECRGWRFAVYLGCHLCGSRFFGVWHRELLRRSWLAVFMLSSIARCRRRGRMCCALHKSKLDRMLDVLTSWNSWKRSLVRGARNSARLGCATAALSHAIDLHVLASLFSTVKLEHDERPATATCLWYKWRRRPQLPIRGRR
jgi:hypothetical protein